MPASGSVSAAESGQTQSDKERQGARAGGSGSTNLCGKLWLQMSATELWYLGEGRGCHVWDSMERMQPETFAKLVKNIMKTKNCTWKKKVVWKLSPNLQSKFLGFYIYSWVYIYIYIYFGV